MLKRHYTVYLLFHQFIAVLLLIVQIGDEIYEFALSVAKHRVSIDYIIPMTL